MTQPQPSLAERDATIARVGEVALRMMAGTVTPACRRSAQASAEQSPGTYPWEEIVALVLAEPIDPSDLVRRGLGAQRDWLCGAAEAQEPSRVRHKPLKKRAFGKRLLAMLIVRGSVYTACAVLFVAILVLLRAALPWLDIYEIGERLRHAFEGLGG